MEKMNFSSALTHPIFKVAKIVATENNIEAYVIGGFVRDLILKSPSKDIDIVVIGDGLEYATKVAERLYVKKVDYFKNFGTAHFRYKDIDVEFVGARKESYSFDSRKPVVENGTLEEDQNRRDFTINALALSLNEASFGDLLDPFDGLSDLEKGIIRTPLEPNRTYSDDPLRMMRAIRFATRLGFTIEKESLIAISKNAERLSIISQERITDELNKIILTRTPSKGFEYLFKTNLLPQFFPEMCELHGVETINGKSHKDNFYHTIQVLDNIALNTDDLFLRWSAILHDIGKPKTKRFNDKTGWTFHNHEEVGARMVKHIFKRLRLPLDHKMKYVEKLVRLHLRPIALVSGKVTDSAIRRLLSDAGDDVDDLMTLCNADITSKNEMKVKRIKENFKLVQSKLKDVEEKDHIRNFQPPIRGEEIMKAFNLGPCSEIGELKSKIKEAILEGEIPNEYEAAYQYMIKIALEMGLNQKNN